MSFGGGGVSGTGEDSSCTTYVCANCTDPLEFKLFSAVDTFAHPKREGFLTWTYATPEDELQSESIEDCIKTKIIPISKALGTIFLYDDENEEGEGGGDEDESVEKETKTKVKVEEDKRKWKLCRKCATILLELYKMYDEFLQLCKEDSLVFQKYLGERQTVHGKGQQNQVIKPKIAASKTKFSGTFSRLQNFKSFPKIQSKPKMLAKRMSDTEDAFLPAAVKVELEEYDSGDFSDPDDAQFDPDFVFTAEGEGSDEEESAEAMGQFMITPDKSSTPYKGKKRGRPRKDRSVTSSSFEESYTSGQKRETEEGDASEDYFQTELDCDYEEGDQETIGAEGDNYEISDSDDDNDKPWKPKSRSRSTVPGRKRGRPKKIKDPSAGQEVKRKRGRPSKLPYERTRNVFTCEYCGKEAKSRWNLNLHIKCVHEKIRPYSCKSCPKTFFAKHALNVHAHRFHGAEKPSDDTKYKCEEPGCGKTFAYPAGLHGHKLSHQPREKYKNACTLCGWKFKHAFRLREHMLVHTEERPSICDQCGGAFKSNRALQKHMMSQHPTVEDTQKLPSCHICGKVLKNPWNLRLHIRSVHEGLKPHQCQFCGKAFSCSSNLKIHITGVPGSFDGGCQSRVNKGRPPRAPRKVRSESSSVMLDHSERDNLDNSSSSSLNMNPINFSTSHNIHHPNPNPPTSTMGHNPYSESIRSSGFTDIMSSVLNS